MVVDEPMRQIRRTVPYAQLIAKEIFTELLPYLNIYPDETGDAEETPAGAAEQGADNENLTCALRKRRRMKVWRTGPTACWHEGISNSGTGAPGRINQRRIIPSGNCHIYR